MIIDIHTHIFPPAITQEREAYLQADPTFRELYAHPKATLAKAEDLLESMDAAGIDVSIALGFAWTAPEVCRRHNDYLLERAAASRGRILPFCSLPLAAGFEAVEAEMLRCIEQGAPGFGELRPGNLGFDLSGDEAKRLGELAAVTGSILLFHASEPVGHQYSGKQGGDIGALYQFIVEHPGVRIVAAHWGGGLPFYARMPEVRLALAGVSFDTAATSLLYTPEIYGDVARLLSSGSILFGSDYPLLSQKRSRERIESCGLPQEDITAILGGNAAALLSLTPVAAPQ